MVPAAQAGVAPRSTAENTTLIIKFLDVAKDGAWIDPEVPRCLSLVPSVELQGLPNVAKLEGLFGFAEWYDLSLVVAPNAEVIRIDERTVGHDDGFLDAVLELPDVARPVRIPHRTDRLVTEALALASVLLRERVQEELGELMDVIAAVPEGRKIDGDLVEPIEEVLAKAARSNFIGEVLVGRRDDSDVHGPRGEISHSLDDALL